MPDKKALRVKSKTKFSDNSSDSDDFNFKKNVKKSPRKKSKLNSDENNVSQLRRSARKKALNFKETDEDDDDDSSYSGWVSVKVTPKKRAVRNNKKENEKSNTPSKLVDKFKSLSTNCDDKSNKSTPKKTSKKISSKSVDTPNKDTPSSKIATPNSGLKLKKNVLMPSEFLKRKLEFISAKNTLEKVRTSLHVSSVPSSLPCRENEFADVYNFLHSKLTSGNSGCMYVAGVPGSGKTATVTEVVRNLKMNEDDDVPDFDYVEVNGMRLSEPKQVYVQILKELSGEILMWDQAYEILTSRFTKKSNKKKPVVILVDELDVIYTKRQDVVYNILDWPSKSNSGVIIIAISNTMDLPERLLMGRVASRLGLTRLPFHPYTYKQLETIVATRLQGTDSFTGDAVQLVARKVAAVSGDARRALDICRRATELAASEETCQRVQLKHVNNALTEMISSDQIKCVKNLTHFEKIFLQAILAEVSRTGVEETNYQNIVKQFKTLAALDGFQEPSHTVINSICQRLTKRRIITTEYKQFSPQQIYLNISADDVHYSLQHSEYLD